MPRHPSASSSPDRRAASQLAILVREERKAVGLSQQQLAQNAGTSIGAVQKIEQDKSPDPGFVMIGKLAGALRVEMNPSKRKAFERDLLRLLLLQPHS